MRFSFALISGGLIPTTSLLHLAPGYYLQVFADFS